MTGMLVKLPLKKAPHTCKGCVVLEHRKKVTHLNILKAMNGMLKSTPLWHGKFREDLEMMGFTFNAWDAFMANRSANGKTHTVRFQVDA